MEKLLLMKGITKRFPGVLALDHVDLELEKGEILAILGENGAGKSTLLKILSGLYSLDEGEIWISGEKMNFRSPAEALHAGVSIIYQELNYLNDLTVAENIFVGRYPMKNRLQMDWKRLFEDGREVLARLGTKIDPKAYVRDLSTAEKQLVEIARAIAQPDTKILVMDEPTAALNETEVRELLALVKKIASTGIGVLFISHRLEDIFNVAQRVEVLRDGKYIAQFPVSNVSKDELIEAMVGRSITDMYPRKEIKKGEVIFEVRGLSNHVLDNISFSVRRGEMLGVFGLMGAGRTEMCKAIFGASKLTAGEILVENKPVRINSPRDAKKAGIAYVPNERKTEGLILIQSVKENLCTAMVDKYVKCKGLLVDREMENENAERWIKGLSIATSSKDVIIQNLSGGNQQKVVLGKWLETAPKIIILNEPTRGIDVGAKVEIYKIMEQLCEQGMAVILISSEQPEILSLTDRCIVLCRGKKTGELPREEYTQEKLMYYAIGGQDENI